MKDDEFDAFVAAAVVELQEKQGALTAKWRLGTYDRFLFDQPTAALQFLDRAGRVHVRATVVPIGSYSARSRTWKWSWANESFLAPLRLRADGLRQLEALTGMHMFGQPAFVADEGMAGEVAAMAVKQLGAIGCYRAPSSNSDLYLAIMSLGEAQ